MEIIVTNIDSVSEPIDALIIHVQPLKLERDVIGRALARLADGGSKVVETGSVFGVSYGKLIIVTDDLADHFVVAVKKALEIASAKRFKTVAMQLSEDSLVGGNESLSLDGCIDDLVSGIVHSLHQKANTVETVTIFVYDNPTLLRRLRYVISTHYPL